MVWNLLETSGGLRVQSRLVAEARKAELQYEPVQRSDGSLGMGG